MTGLKKTIDAACRHRDPDVAWRAILAETEFDETQISVALNLIKPKDDKRTECREGIKTALMFTSHNPSVAAPRSKQNKKALKDLASALDRIRRAQQALAWSDAIALGDLYSFLPSAIAHCKKESNKPLSASGPSSHRQRQAASMAYALLRRYSDCDENAFAISKNSLWHKLAKVLHGEDVSLLPYLSRYQQRLPSRV